MDGTWALQLVIYSNVKRLALNKFNCVAFALLVAVVLVSEADTIFRVCK